MQLYGKMAVNEIKKNNRKAVIYHYRSGFGGESVKIAKKMGLITLCDHSIVHPDQISLMINEHSRLCPQSVTGPPLSRFWAWVLSDLEQADRILVNSAFAKNTFIERGWDPKRVHCIYMGVDDQFLEFVNASKLNKKDPSAPLSLLFAGKFEKRKGAEPLISSLHTIQNRRFTLDILGEIDSKIKRQHPAFLNFTHIHYRGMQTRYQLAQNMKIADALVLPSLAEGSARVIFEAMACGCYIITTPNAGSIVEDGIHGAIVPPNDIRALKHAIVWAIEHRKEVKEIGYQNALYIQRHFRQSHYGHELVNLYNRLLNI